MSIEQVTGDKKIAGCLACKIVVAHRQVASFTASGFKIYTWVPAAHRRPDGTACQYMSTERSQMERL